MVLLIISLFDRNVALRAMNNKLREDANNLEDAVDKPSEEINILESYQSLHIGRQRWKKNWGVSLDQQSVSVNELVELVKEIEAIPVLKA